MALNDDPVALLERSYGAMVRIAAYRGAAEVEGVVREAAVAASAAGPDGLRERLFGELAVRVAARERAAGRPVLVDPEADPDPTVAEDRFEPAASPWAGFFVDVPPSLEELRPGSRRAEPARAAAMEALADLPLGNRLVLVLRDVAGWSPDEVAVLLGVDLDRQRVALHGARARVRRALERVADESDA